MIARRTNNSNEQTKVVLKSEEKDQGLALDAMETSLKRSKISEQELSQFSTISAREKKSLRILIPLMNEAIFENLDKNSVTETLEKLKLEPIQMDSENPYTGKLSIIRTKNILPGTRYFHAQYFSSNNQSHYLQYISFEFKPGPESLAIVKEMVRKEFNLAKPVTENENYVSWKKEDRVIWIKKLDVNDLKKKDPYNSYDLKTDVGTVVMTVETEIH